MRTMRRHQDSTRWVTPLIACSLLFGRAGAARADVVHLNNGSVMRGVVVASDAEEMTLRVGPRMKMQFSAHEIARVERQSAEENAKIARAWEVAHRPPSPSAPPAAAATRRPRAEAGAAAPTPEQARRDTAIDAMDLIEGSTTPEQLEHELGPPQRKQPGRTPAGQAYLDWAYDVGEGMLRVVRFLDTGAGYFASSETTLPADQFGAGASAE